METKTCIYCQQEASEQNPVKVWSETQEEICYECRKDFLEEEFFPTTAKDIDLEYAIKNF